MKYAVDFPNIAVSRRIERYFAPDSVKRFLLDVLELP